MDILVCIKQVPASNKVEVDPVTGVLLRNGADSKMNPYDLYALETALKIREEVGGTISVISMGPPQAMTVIREAFAMGVDRGALLSDRRFGGADVLATSYTIAQGIKKMGDFDLILCGKQTTDGDTAQVGPEIAEHIGLPQVTYAIEAEAEEDRLVIKKEVEAGFEKVAVSYPCLITVTKPSFDPRFPTIKTKMAAKKAEINVLAYADLEAGMDNERIGLKGSPTKVKKTFTPEVKTSGVKINEPTSEEGAEKLFAILCEDKVF